MSPVIVPPYGRQHHASPNRPCLRQGQNCWSATLRLVLHLLLLCDKNAFGLQASSLVMTTKARLGHCHSPPRAVAWRPARATCVSTTRRRRMTQLSLRPARRRNFEDDYDDYEDEEGASFPFEYRQESEDDMFWDDDNEDTAGSGRKEDSFEWEPCGKAQVLLPPPSVLLPTTIIHFVGGTVIGAMPQFWYKDLLQELVLNTQAVVVATSVPVFVKNPLSHAQLAMSARKQFETAYRTVLLDEYGPAIHQVPVCGVGHSLGARLLVILTTLLNRSSFRDRRRRPHATPQKQQQDQSPPTASSMYKSMVLMSFTNHGAAAGIPGVHQLNKAAKSINTSSLNGRREPRGRPGPYAEDPFADDSDDPYGYDEEDDSVYNAPRRPRRRRRRQADWTLDDDDYDDDYEDEKEWGELFQELKDVVQEQVVGRVQSAFSSTTSSLQVNPTPDELWKALREDGLYTVPETLVVQFDNDEIDQSSQFVSALVQATGAEEAAPEGGEDSSLESSSDSDSSSRLMNQTDIKFARLRGTHFAPVSFAQDEDEYYRNNKSNKEEEMIMAWLQHINMSNLSRLLGRVVHRGQRRGRAHGPSSSDNRVVLTELRQSIARYITEIVTK